MIKIFEKFRFYKQGVKAAYSAVVLDDNSKYLLLSNYIYNNIIFKDWKIVCDHMTICMGELPEHLKRYWLGEEVSLTVTELGISDKAVAVKVTGGFIISKKNDEVGRGSEFPHITLAINPIDGKPADSNKIENWTKVEKIKIRGIIKEVQI